ncbi:serine/threonine protein kinase [Myxococcota bacterium]|nr:serine/threonine protein kinase [Myxococcota bacterium]
MLVAGDRIGEWVVESQLGEGGMGAVFACHSGLSQRVKAAVKVLKPHDLGAARERFVQEVEVLASLKHPAVVQVLGGGEDLSRGLLYMAMELVEGEPLSERLKRGPLGWDEACRLFSELGDGLVLAHRAGVTHRDIKPENIMITREGRPKLLDFGVAVQTGAERYTQDGSVAGTLAYMAPEVFQGAQADPRADIYALGLVLWEALTGKSAFGGENDSGGAVVARMIGAKLSAEPMDPGPSSPEGVRDAVRRATDPIRESRLHDLEQLVLALRAARGETSSLPPRPPTDARPPVNAAKPAAPKPSGGMGTGAKVAIGVAITFVALCGFGSIATILALTALGSSLDTLFTGVSDTVEQAGGGGHSTTIPGLGGGKVPAGFPFEVPKDAEIIYGAKNSSNGQVSYAVTFTTDGDPKKLVDRYRRDFVARKMELSESTSETSDGVTVSVSGYRLTGEVASVTTMPNPMGSGSYVTLSYVPASR